MMEYPIKTPSGKSYITIVDVDENLFNIRLDTYHNLSVVLDKKCISDMIEVLQRMMNENFYK